MPNWCSNTLRVTGDETVLTEAKKALAEPYRMRRDPSAAFSGPLLLWNMARPWQTPEEEETYWEDDHAWYEMHTRQWGTKWEIEAEIVEPETTSTSVLYRFDTAWAPPVPAVYAASLKFPDLVFRLEYDEPGVDVAGYVTFQGGETLEEFDGPSRHLWCDVCDHSEVLDWGAERVCPNSNVDTELGHERDAHILSGDIAASVEELARALVSCIPEDDGRYVGSWVNIVSHNTAFKDPATVADLYRHILEPTPQQAHVVLSSLTASDVERLLVSPDPQVARATHLGTVAYALLHRG